MFMSEHLQEKWAPILEHNDLDPIKDSYKKAVTSVLLENQEQFLRQERGMLAEASPTTTLVQVHHSLDLAAVQLVLVL